MRSKRKTRPRAPLGNSAKQLPTTEIPPGRTHIDESKSQDTEKKPSRWRAVLTWASPTITALIIVYATSQSGLSVQIQLTNKQKRQQAYSELLGEKAVIAQYLYSHAEAYIHSEFHDARWKLATQLQGFIDLQETKKLDLEEAKRWMRKNEDLTLEVAKTKKSLFETLGTIRSYFSLSQDLKDLTHRIFYAPKIEIESPSSQLDPAHLEDWRIKERKRVGEIIEKDYIKPIDDLAEYLEKNF